MLDLQFCTFMATIDYNLKVYLHIYNIYICNVLLLCTHILSFAVCIFFQVQGMSQSTGFIKLHFSSLQENIPMRVDVINRQGQPNGFLILRYAILGDCETTGGNIIHPSAADTAREITRLPTLPSNFAFQHQPSQQQHFRGFAIGEPQIHPKYQENRVPKPSGARQSKKVGGRHLQEHTHRYKLI